jgi:hypothetical protein
MPCTVLCSEISSLDKQPQLLVAPLNISPATATFVSPQSHLVYHVDFPLFIDLNDKTTNLPNLLPTKSATFGAEHPQPFIDPDFRLDADTVVVAPQSHMHSQYTRPGRLSAAPVTKSLLNLIPLRSSFLVMISPLFS